MTTRPALDNTMVEEFLEKLKEEKPDIYALFERVVRERVNQPKKIKEMLDNFARDQMRPKA